MTYLYVLFDPRDGQIRYVGQTINIDRRRTKHAAEPEPRMKSPFASWLRKLRRLGLRPKLVPVMRFEHGEDADVAERAWIKMFRDRGGRLVNFEDGGHTGRAGMTGKKHTEEWKASMRGRVPWNKGRPATPELRAILSAARRGKLQTPESNAKRSRSLMGHPVSRETRERISRGHRGKPGPSAEVRARIAATLRGRSPSVETRAKLAAAQRARREREKLARVP